MASYRLDINPQSFGAKFPAKRRENIVYHLVGGKTITLFMQFNLMQPMSRGSTLQNLWD